MPSIPSGNQDGIDVLAVQYFEHVAVQDAIRVVVVRVDHFFDPSAATGLDIAVRHELDVRLVKHATQHDPTPVPIPDPAQH